MAANLPSIAITDDINSPDYDAIVVVSSGVSGIPFNELKDPITSMISVDGKAEAGVFVVPTGLPSKRLIYSGVGPLDKDYDDVRR